MNTLNNLNIILLTLKFHKMKKTILAIVLTLIPFLLSGQAAIKVDQYANVGIGTNTPASRLDVIGLIKSRGGTIQRNGQSASILCERTDRAAMIMGAGWDAGFSIDQDYAFSIYANDRGQVLNRILTGGSLMMTGVGTTKYFGFGVYNPTERIHVAGNIFATGTITPSDRRLKKNVTDFKDGLNIIKKLNPIRYQYNGKAGLETNDYHISVYADELQEVAPYLVEEFVHQDKDDEGNVVLEETYLKIRDSEIKYLILNATKEQQTLIEKQQRVIDTQQKTLEIQQQALETVQKELEDIKEMLRGKEVKKTENVLLEGKGHLHQNTPNPFSKTTIIQYELTDANAEATIKVFSLKGELLQSIPVTEKRGQISLEISDLPAGIYTYSLIVDNVIVDTKKMVLSK